MTYIPPHPNGLALPAASSPVVLAAQSIGGTPQTTPPVNYDLLTGTMNGWYDALGFSWLSCTIVGNAAVTAGSVLLECTNDPVSMPNGISHYAADSSSLITNRTGGFTNVSSGSVRQIDAALSMRYVRLRVANPFPNGAVTVSTTLRQVGPPFTAVYGKITSAFAVGGNALGTVGTVPGTSLFGAFMLGTGSTIDVAAATITSTTQSAQISLVGTPTAASFCVTVTAISGTNASLDVVIRGNLLSSGGAYQDLYHFERITANGTYSSPPLRLACNSVSYQMTVNGTTPSITSSITRLSKSTPGLALRQYYNRTITGVTLGSVTPAYYAETASRVQVAINTTYTTGTACIIDLQASEDGITWSSVQSLTTVNGTSQMIVTAFSSKWMRGRVSTAGHASQVTNYVCFTALGPV